MSVALCGLCIDLDVVNVVLKLGLSQKQKTFDTNDSRVVPHRSTELAQRCLVSEIGRDRTFSPWYD